MLKDRGRNPPVIVEFGARKLRRPGIGKIIAELRIKHPSKSENSLMAEAKVLWHQRERNK